MNPERWQRINEIFHAAIERGDDERNSFLAESCQGDEELFNEVEKLVSAHNRTDDFIQNPVFTDAVHILLTEQEVSGLIGKRFGVYRIIEEIGRGGMGAVFLAERVDQEFEKRVAVKIIKRGMDTDAVLNRFRHERQILAALDHPNIARLLDGGTTEDGLPYFVMEYIEGSSIVRYADSHGLSVKERLELFRKVCAAVAYAHQRLIIHRDLKPSNILVDNEGEPKLLDFGIAKLMNPEPDDLENNQTATGLRLMTPEYASPEQAQGLPVTTLTDVYSLGVVLYELLTGCVPFEFKNQTPLEFAQKISNAEPKKPSDALSQNIYGAETRKNFNEKITDKSLPAEIHNPKSLRGDLDNIVLKAMRKESEQRYASVGQFSEDIRRHLVGLPVIARPITVSYRLSKFVRRNRIAVGAAAIIFFLLVGGIIATTRQTVRAQAEKARAEKRFNDVRKLAHSVLFDYHDAVEDLPGSTPIRARLVKDAMEYLDSLAAEAGNDTSLQIELATAYERIGDVQGGTMKANLGDTAGSIESYRKALAILQSLAASEPRNAETRYKIASCYKKLGTLLGETGNTKESLDVSRQALTFFQELADENPTDLDLLFELGSTYNRVGLILKEQGDFSGALESYQKEISLYQSLPAAERESEKTRRAFSRACEHIASAFISTGELEKAFDYNRRGLEIRQSLVKDFPQNAYYPRALSVSFYWEGRILSNMGRTQEALQSYQNDLDIVEKLLLADPDNEAHRGDAAYALIEIGDLHSELNDTKQALANYRRAQTIRAGDVKADPTNLWKRSSLIEAYAKICKTLAKTGQAENAETECEITFSLMEKTSLEPTNVQDRSLFADSYSDIAEAYSTLASLRKDNLAERRKYWITARQMYERSFQIWQDLQNRGIISNANAEKPAAVAREIEKYNSALNF